MTMTAPTTPAVLTWLTAATERLERLAATQAVALEEASRWCAEAIAADGLVHCFGTGHSRIPVEELFPRYGSYPGFNPMVELSMTFHTQVVGSNGQRQAMFIERTPGLAEVILDNFSFGAHDVLLVFSAGGTTAVPVEMARGARQRGLRVIAVTSVEQSMASDVDPAVGPRLLDEADLVIDLCTPHADALDRPSTASRRRSGRARPSPPSPSSIASRSGPPSSSRSAGPATGHHPSVRRRRRTLAGTLRRRLCRTRAAHRPCHHPGRPVRGRPLRVRRWIEHLESRSRPRVAGCQPVDGAGHRQPCTEEEYA